MLVLNLHKVSAPHNFLYIYLANDYYRAFSFYLLSLRFHLDTILISKFHLPNNWSCEIRMVSRRTLMWTMFKFVQSNNGVWQMYSICIPHWYFLTLCMRSILKKYKLISSFTSSLNTIFGLKWKISEITRRFMLDIFFLYFKANHCFSWWVVVNAVGLLDVESTCWAARQKTGGRAPTKIHIATVYIPMDFLVQIRIELYYIYSEQDPYNNYTIIHRK